MNRKNISFVKRGLKYSIVMGAIGYFVLHPISMIIVKLTKHIPCPPQHNVILCAFSLHHLPMGLFFSLLSLIFGILIAFLHHVIYKKTWHIQQLEGLLPICANCKAIRDDSNAEEGHGKWVTLESYFSKMSDQKLSHGICPDCMKKLYPDFLKKDEELVSTVNS